MQCQAVTNGLTTAYPAPRPRMLNALVRAPSVQSWQLDCAPWYANCPTRGWWPGAAARRTVRGCARLELCGGIIIGTPVPLKAASGRFLDGCRSACWFAPLPVARASRVELYMLQEGAPYARPISALSFLV